MKYHPATLMIWTWLACAAAFLILPFQLVTRTVSLYGFVVLGLFIAAFIVGTLVGSPVLQQQPRRETAIDWRSADRLMHAVALFAIAMFLVELARGDIFDLAGSYLARTDRATAVLFGSASESNLFFQLGFQTYPVGFVYIVRAIGFSRRPTLWRVGVFGLLPPLVASLAMGGRAPLLYVLLMFFFAFRVRRELFPVDRRQAAPARRNWLLITVLGIAGLSAMNYFAKVFIVRAEVGGGIREAFDHAALDWGISFDGYLAGPIGIVLGEGNTYLLFIFVWYLVQGLVIANTVFTDYAGPPHLGIYGIDLVTAVMRRINGDLVADRLLRLLDINIYGFFPSAFGSLYVDLKFLGLAVVAIWGWLAAVVYRNVRAGIDPRWLLLAPFVVFGIVFSLINTPLGFSNGLVTHFWLLVVFFTVRSYRLPATDGLAARPA